ncbi:MAG: CDP-glycerol glycerophosphotransferase family protein [Clostridia bacterium]|nr:CDP-glycerol glycerophosphotransferase family protein [Clostridia bacterium]
MKKTLLSLRRLVCTLIIKALLQPFRALKIKKNRVLFSSFLEKQYSCNPKYISRELKRLYGDKLEICWAFRYPEKFSFLAREGIRVLDARSLKFVLYALSARVVVTNTYYKPTLPRRKQQFYLRTWHGGGAYKRVGRYEDMPPLDRIITRLRQSGADLYLSSSRAFTKLTLRDSFGFSGEVLEKGMPRNDLLINPPDEEEIMRIRREIGLKDGESLCLYAPTYRRDARVHEQKPDYEQTCAALSARFGGKWVTGYRSHHVTMYLDKKSLSQGALDLSAYPDMQELLLVCGALITDYSSSIWDAGLAGKRVFLYCPDLNEYLSERDFYTDIHSWPFPLALNMQELKENISAFNEEKYAEKLKKHYTELGSFETGRAAYFAAKRIGKECGIDTQEDA